MSEELKMSIFETIQNLLKTNINKYFIESLKTKKGNTQNAERIYIQKIKDIFDENNITYEEASSQQSKDFRNINNTGLNLECKKTDSVTIYFNDTCPNKDIDYFIIFTGNKTYPPQLVFINGQKIVETSMSWIDDYTHELTQLKDKYCRGENKKNLCGMMEVYARPTYKANIVCLLEK
tara:strand:- start:711 stop:1244 length:534 start_codon:yes stop_codon:yes gene_type:complete